MSEDIRQEIKEEVTKVRFSIIEEVKKQIKMFYVTIFGMIFCLILGVFIGTSQTDTTSKMVYHTQKKVDLLLNKFNIKYKK